MHATNWLLWHSDLTKFNFGQVSTMNLAAEAYDALQYPQLL